MTQSRRQNPRRPEPRLGELPPVRDPKYADLFLEPPAPEPTDEEDE